MKNKQKRFIKRNEIFGTTVFDRNHLKHQFFTNEEYKQSNLNINQVEDWQGDLSNVPNGLLFSPIRVYFDLTEDCNLRCKTCYNSSGRKKPDEMTTEETLLALDGLRNDNVFDIRFSGGELTQRADWFDVLKHAKDLGFSVSANTNGVYDNNVEVAEKFSQLNLEQITVSIDGAKNLHDFIRGPGNYNRTISAIKELSKRDNTLRINTIISKNTINDAKEILDFAVKYVQEINFFQFRPLGRGKGLSQHATSFEELNEFNQYMSELKKPYIDQGLNVLHGQVVIKDNSINEEATNKYGLYQGSTDGFTRWNVSQNGDMAAGGYTVHIRPDLKMSNIKEEGYSLLDIWRNSSKLKDFRKMSAGYVARCNSCPEKEVSCVGECIEFALIRETTGENRYCNLVN
jgi:MoaA/NifB/PqqE/SkfB family radical SAM enzyme